MNKKHLASIIVLFLAISLIAAGCGTSTEKTGGTHAKSGDESPKATEVSIAVVGPMTGNGAEYGKAFKDGAELAIAHYDEQLAEKGIRVKLVYGDDKNDPKEAANVAQKVASDPSVYAVIGHWSSSSTFAGIPIYERNKIPMITPTATHPDLTKTETKWIFRSTSTQEAEGANLANIAVNKLNKKNIAVLYMNSDWGKANATYFKQNAEAKGATIVSYEAYPPGQNIDFTPALTKIKGLNPDLIYLGSLYNESALIVKQAKEMGIKAAYLVPEANMSEGFLKAKEAIEGVYLNSYYNPASDSPLVQKFAAEFKQKYGYEAGEFNVLAYDAATIVLEAVKKAGVPSREKIRDEMEKIEGLQTLTSTVKFDEKRNNYITTFADLVVQNNKFEILK